MTIALFDFDELTAEPQHDLSPFERFCVFHAANPQVFETLRRMTQDLIDRGRVRLSVKMLIETLRWNFYMKTEDPNSRFKINNSYASFYARLLVETFPEWEGVFELRERHHNDT